jgi:hypothetical protein
MPEELQKIGPLERAISDFFRTSPGRDLPAVLLVLVNAGLFISAIRKAHSTSWLPLLFALFNILYILGEFWFVGVSWSISGWVVGPRTSPYQGYHRTWYGIVLHFALWGVFLLALVKASRTATTLQGVVSD